MVRVWPFSCMTPPWDNFAARSLRDDIGMATKMGFSLS
jgi:hypothetical protein